MKKIKVKLKKSQKSKNLIKFFLPILSLVILIFYTFHDAPKLLVSGEAFMWLIKSTQDSFWDGFLFLRSFEISSVLISTLFSKAFGLNFSLYYWAWIITIIVISILLFFLTYILTGRRLIAFSAALIFGVSYVGQMGLIGWQDTSFIGREPNLILLIPSFIFLHLYLMKSKLKFYLISILLFFLGIGFGQFGLILAPAYIVYPLCWLVFNSKERYKFRRILISASFLLISIFFVYIHSTGGINAQVNKSYTDFLLHPQTYHYIEQIPLQLAHWTNYLSLVEGVRIHSRSFEYRGDIIQYFANLKLAKEAINIIVIIYILATLAIYFQLPKQRPLLLTIILATCSALIENIYIGHYIPEQQSGASRYLYYPTILLSIFWALFLGATFWKKRNRLLLVLGFAILGGYYLINTVLISTIFDQILYGKSSPYQGSKSLFAYIVHIKPEIKPNTLIITPWDEMGCGETQFLNDQINKGVVTFMPNVNNCAPPGGWEAVASKSAHVVKLTYDKNCKCVIEEKIK